MTSTPQYSVEQWTSANAEFDYRNQAAHEITVNDRAATRQAIINMAQQAGINFVTRSDWAAHKAKSSSMQDDWSYRGIAIHHAGRSFTCGPAALQLQDIQSMQMNPDPFHLSQGKTAADDIAYHYALDCFGNIYEGRDIRFKGEHLFRYNTGMIGIVLLENLADPQEREDIVGKVQEFIGLFSRKKPIIPDAQKATLRSLIQILREVFNIEMLGGHREFPHQTAGEGRICPGNAGVAFVRELRASLGISAPH